MPQPTWTPNPYAIASLLLGEQTEIDLAKAGELVSRFFNLKQTMIFDPVAGKPAPFQSFIDLANLTTTALPFDKVWEHELVREARGVFGDAAIARVLPFLIPIDDYAFRAPGAPSPAVAAGTTRFLGDYRPIDAYMLAGASYLDPAQGALHNCYLISSMISIAWATPAAWQKTLDDAKAAGRDSGFRFNMFHSPSDPRAIDVVADVPFDELGRRCYAYSDTDKRESWPSIVEKAYACARRRGDGGEPSPADYLLIDTVRVYPPRACQMLVGGDPVLEFNNWLEIQPEWHSLRLPRCCNEAGVTTHPTMAWTLDPTAPLETLTWEQTGLIPGHAYAVLGIIEQTGERFVVLRNPHGVSLAGGDMPARYPSGTWSPVSGPDRTDDVALNQMGVFALPMDWFNKCMSGVGWVE